MDGIQGRITSIGGRSGAVPRLEVRTDLTSKGEEVLDIISFSCRASIARTGWQSVNGIPVAPTELFIGEGHLVNSFGISTMTKNSEMRVDFYFNLTPAVIQAIERHRQGQDVAIRLTITVVSAEREPTNRTPKCIHRIDARSSGYDYITTDIPRSRWLDTLKQMGYAEYYSMDIPLPRISKTSVTTPVLPILQRAWENFENGSDRETLAACWEAMEVLAKKHGATQPDQNAYVKMLTGTAHTEKTLKLANALRNWTDFLHLGRHEHDPSVELDHRDAEFALVMTHACFAYLSKHKLNKGDKKKALANNVAEG